MQPILMTKVWRVMIRRLAKQLWKEMKHRQAWTAQDIQNCLELIEQLMDQEMYAYLHEERVDAARRKYDSEGKPEWQRGAE